MFFLPLPLSNTLETLANVDDGMAMYNVARSSAVRHCQWCAYTKDKVMSQTSVDVKRIKAAIQKLRETNWLYQNVSDLSLDDVGRKVVRLLTARLVAC